jgi:hypothetical protein
LRRLSMSTSDSRVIGRLPDVAPQLRDAAKSLPTKGDVQASVTIYDDLSLWLRDMTGP